MDQTTLTQLLNRVQTGDCSIAQAIVELRHFPAETVEDACLDHQRTIRTGRPEVIYGASKTAAQIITIAQSLLNHAGPVLATKIEPEKAALITKALPELTYSCDARILFAQPRKIDHVARRGPIVVICAGTSDIPIAEEARLTAECLGNPVTCLYDAGVAGLHRLLARQHLLSEAAVIIVAAGMEGALPSVVGGLVSCPVIAVPTSVGYGASFGGIAALLGMLNSCAPGVAVVNIDNGFGAGCMADTINRV